MASEADDVRRMDAYESDRNVSRSESKSRSDKILLAKDMLGLPTGEVAVYSLN